MLPEAGSGSVSHRSVQRPSRKSRRASSARWSSRPAATSSSNSRSHTSASNSANQARNAAKSAGRSLRIASSISRTVLMPLLYPPKQLLASCSGSLSRTAMDSCRQCKDSLQFGNLLTMLKSVRRDAQSQSLGVRRVRGLSCTPLNRPLLWALSAFTCLHAAVGASRHFDLRRILCVCRHRPRIPPTLWKRQSKPAAHTDFLAGQSHVRYWFGEGRLEYRVYAGQNSPFRLKAVLPTGNPSTHALDFLGPLCTEDIGCGMLSPCATSSWGVFCSCESAC
jgi:hypothetical protein